MNTENKDTTKGNRLDWKERVEKARGMLKHIAPGVDLAEELIRDRREEARREEES